LQPLTSWATTSSHLHISQLSLQVGVEVGPGLVV
jgi:hypothetical protein